MELQSVHNVISNEITPNGIYNIKVKCGNSHRELNFEEECNQI